MWDLKKSRTDEFITVSIFHVHIALNQGNVCIEKWLDPN